MAGEGGASFDADAGPLSCPWELLQAFQGCSSAAKEEETDKSSSVLIWIVLQAGDSLINVVDLKSDPPGDCAAGLWLREGSCRALTT